MLCVRPVWCMTTGVCDTLCHLGSRRVSRGSNREATARDGTEAPRPRPFRRIVHALRPKSRCMPVTRLRNDDEEDSQGPTPRDRAGVNGAATPQQNNEMSPPCCAVNFGHYPCAPHHPWCASSPSPRCSCPRCCGSAANYMMQLADPTKSSPSYIEHTSTASGSPSSTPRVWSEPLMLPFQAVANHHVGALDFDYQNSGVSGLDVYMLYASPLDASPLNIRAEVEAIGEAFRDARSGVRLHVGVATASSLTKLLTLSRSRKGLVLHLCAHAVSSETHGVGLVLEDGKGKAHILWQRELEDLLALSEVAEQGRCNPSLLFLGVCNSEALAQVFVECGCPHVISLRTQVQDAAARKFAQQFYFSLAMRESLRSAWDGARRALRIEADHGTAAQADSFMLFGQQGSEQATLHSLCGADSSSCPRGAGAGGFAPPVAHLRDMEDAEAFLEMKLPARTQDFVGRGGDLHAVLQVLSTRRACVVHGPAGIGKSALGGELAHFSSAPGRPFSCAARIVNIDSAEVSHVVAALEEAVVGIGEQLRVPLQQWPGESRTVPSSARSSTSAFSSASDAIALADPYRDMDPMSMLLLARQRLCRALQAVEKARRSSRLLLIIDDDAGALSHGDEVRRLLGELLDNTHNVHVVICSREPMYTALGATKAVNIPLCGLAEPDAARLLLLRIHRPLAPPDFAPGSAPWVPPASLEKAIKSLRGHPILRTLGGNPGQIGAVSSQVHEGGPSLMELAVGSISLPGGHVAVAVPC